MGLFTPIYMKSGLSIKQKQKALEKLKAIADPGKLAAVVREAPDEDIRAAAVANVGDAELLVGLALNGPSQRVRRLAANRLCHLHDDDALVRVITGTRDEDIQLNVICVRGDAALARVAEGCENDRIREKAVERIRDQAALERLAKASPVAEVRRSAAKRAENQALLAQIALGDADANVRSEAAGRLTDSSLLAKIATTDADAKVRKSAVNNTHMTDPAALAKIALEDPESWIRWQALNSRYMSDSAVLAKIAASDPEAKLRKEALKNKHMDDSAVLAKVAVSDEAAEVRELALRNQRLTDAAALAKAALEDPVDTNRYRALCNPNLSDADVFDRAANDATAGYPIRWAAATRLAAVDPDRAVKPLVELLKDPKSQEVDWYKETADLCRNAIAFLELRYKATPDRAVKSTIASIPNGKYGWEQEGSCYMHWDETAHFDIPR